MGGVTFQVCPKCRQERHPTSFSESDHQCKQCRGWYNLQRRYKLSPNEYFRLLAHQNGRCSICNDLLLDPHVDHNHITGQVRGLLCRHCNIALGHFRESLAIMKGAIAYIENNSPWLGLR